MAPGLCTSLDTAKLTHVHLYTGKCSKRLPEALLTLFKFKSVFILYNKMKTIFNLCPCLSSLSDPEKGYKCRDTELSCCCILLVTRKTIQVSKVNFEKYALSAFIYTNDMIMHIIFLTVYRPTVIFGYIDVTIFKFQNPQLYVELKEL